MNNRLRPVVHPYFLEVYQLASRNRWFAQEVQMQQDVVDWAEATPQLRSLVGGILKSFTQIEVLVSDYWADNVAKLPRITPEIVFLAREFSSQEVNHAVAYDHLEATLGLDTYDEFLGDKIAQKRIGDLLNYQNSLALFSGAVEGVSLNVSFAILLMLAKKNKFRGTQQIISWSAHDEALHSKVGILLSQTIGEEIDKKLIYEGFDAIVANEYAFIKSAFKNGDIDEDITLRNAHDFIRRQANSKLRELGLNDFYRESNKVNPLWDNFNTVMKASAYHDFFSGKSGNSYSANVSQNFNEVDLSKMW